MKRLILLLALCIHPFANISHAQSSPALNETCFAWDPNPEPDVIGYRVYLSEDGLSWTEPLAQTTETSACVPNLVQGQAYLAMVTAINAAGLESIPSAPLPFVVAYLLDAEKMDLRSRMDENGDMHLSVEGPVNLMEANGGILQSSTDLEVWTDTPVNWEYSEGVYRAVLPARDARRRFYKLGFLYDH